MPRNNDIHRICIVGSGPITIGQACEFDYSGTQGCKALKSEGYEIILINSNPATIMTDPEMAERFERELNWCCQQLESMIRVSSSSKEKEPRKFSKIESFVVEFFF